VPSIN